jgi:molybdopterin-guanine dinucleotide biosynthesis protein A
MTAGFVLAGGASRRMGRSKALLPFRGATLIEHVVNQVASVATQVRVVGPPEPLRELGLDTLEDWAVLLLLLHIPLPSGTLSLPVTCLR